MAAMGGGGHRGKADIEAFILLVVVIHQCVRVSDGGNMTAARIY